MTQNELHPSTSCGNTFMDKALNYEDKVSKKER